jgi:hypothetical protein
MKTLLAIALLVCCASSYATQEEKCQGWADAIKPSVPHVIDPIGFRAVVQYRAKKDEWTLRQEGPWHNGVAFDFEGDAEDYALKCACATFEYRVLDLEAE